MKRPLSRTLSVGLLLLAACGDDPPPPPPSPATTTPPKPVSAAPIKSATSASAAPSSSAPLPIASIDVPTGPRKWSDFAGPMVPAELKAGTKAWSAMPVSAGWETLKFSLGEVKRAEANDLVFEVPTSATDPKPVEVFVPTAFTIEAKAPEKLEKSDPVMIATGGSRAFGRVVSGDLKSKIKVRYRFAGTQEEKDFEPAEVIRLDGTLRYGAPVAYSQLKEAERGERKLVWYPAQLIQTAEEKAWIVTASGKPIRVEIASVKPMGVQSVHKPGDKVWAVKADELTPAEIAEVVEDGLRYKVKFGAEESTVSLESVTPPLK